MNLSLSSSSALQNVKKKNVSPLFPLALFIHAFFQFVLFLIYTELLNHHFHMANSSHVDNSHSANIHSVHFMFDSCDFHNSCEATHRTLAITIDRGRALGP